MAGGRINQAAAFAGHPHQITTRADVLWSRPDAAAVRVRMLEVPTARSESFTWISRSTQ
jgi:hypothetical protein